MNAFGYDLRCEEATQFDCPCQSFQILLICGISPAVCRRIFDKEVSLHECKQFLRFVAQSGSVSIKLEVDGVDTLLSVLLLQEVYEDTTEKTSILYNVIA